VSTSKQFTFESTSSGTNYKLIGVPGSTSYSATSIFTGIYKQDWRMYRDNGGTSNYLVEYDGSSNFNFGSGKGFLALAKQTYTFSATLSNYTTSGAFPISSTERLEHYFQSVCTDCFVGRRANV